MDSQHTIIAIDGYSSCGKSTLAQSLAKKLHYIYVDSGAMYRAITLYFLRNEINLSDHAHVIEALDHDIHITFEKGEDRLVVLLNHEDVSDEIRKMPVSDNVSAVSAIHQVRIKMVRLQQRLGRSKNIVMDGRDIGTTVFPNAQMKLFMTATPEIRAMRRFKELELKGSTTSFDEIMKNISQRDFTDTTRSESPLRKAEDAIMLDNSYLNQEQQLEFVLDELKKNHLLPDLKIF